MTVEEALGLVEEVKNCSLPWDDAHWEAFDIVINYVKDKLNNSDKSISEFDIQPQPKQEWGEEDESTINDIICYIRQRLGYESEKGKKKIQKCENWLKSLKDRVQPRREWSEEDNRMYNRIVSFIPQHLTAESYTDCINWLKSLRPQNRWKPSGFHLESISDAIAIYEERGINAIGLKEILEELKKLREN